MLRDSLSATPDTYDVIFRSTPFSSRSERGTVIRMSDLDRAISLLARTQHGVFNHRQVVGSGGTKRQAFYRLSSGDWLSLDRGVYALASAPATWRRQLMAAVLSKNRAIVTGSSAGALHSIPGCRLGRPEITVPYSGSAASSVAVVRRRSDFTAIQRVTIDRIPTATVAETLFDLSNRLPRLALEGAVDDCLVRSAVSVGDLQVVLERISGSRLKGTKAFRETIAGLTDDYVPTESELERMLLRAIDDPRVANVNRQARLAWWPALPHRVDAVIPEWWLILEADGRAFHTKRADFERDRQRDNLAAAHGYRVMRFTYRALTKDPAGVLQLVLNAGQHRSLASVVRAWGDPQ